MPVGQRCGIKQRLGIVKAKGKKAKAEPMAKELLDLYIRGALPAHSVGAVAHAALDMHGGCGVIVLVQASSQSSCKG